jgi:hypothetical protein
MLSEKYGIFGYIALHGAQRPYSRLNLIGATGSLSMAEVEQELRQRNYKVWRCIHLEATQSSQNMVSLSFAETSLVNGPVLLPHAGRFSKGS